MKSHLFHQIARRMLGHGVDRGVHAVANWPVHMISILCRFHGQRQAGDTTIELPAAIYDTNDDVI